MKTKIIKLSEVKFLEDINEGDFSIPVGVEEIKTRPYSAYTPSKLASEGKPLVIVDTCPSTTHNGYIDYSILDLREKLTSKKPAIARHLDFILDLVLEKHGISCAELKWKPASTNLKDIVSTDYVYFLKADRFIKIGKSSGSPFSRINDLQTGCPFQITPIAYIKGGLEKEAELHKRFSKYRAYGEWFNFSGELVEFIESIKGTSQND